MGRLKEFLIQEQMRLEGDFRERNHYEYLAWRKQLEEEKQYEQKEKIKSDSFKRNNSRRA